MGIVAIRKSAKLPLTHELLDYIEDLLALAHQYRDDLRHPPTADSITRRLAAIDVVLAKVTGDA